MGRVTEGFKSLKNFVSGEQSLAHNDGQPSSKTSQDSKSQKNLTRKTSNNSLSGNIPAKIREEIGFEGVGETVLEPSEWGKSDECESYYGPVHASPPAPAEEENTIMGDAMGEAIVLGGDQDGHNERRLITNGRPQQERMGSGDDFQESGVGHINHEREHYDHEVLKDNYRKLRKKFKNLKSQSQDVDRALKEHHTAELKLQRENQGLWEQNESVNRALEEHHTAELKLREEFRKKFHMLKRENEGLRKQNEKLVQNHHGAMEEINRQTNHITQLTEDISRSGNRLSTTTRDDDYFDAEFSKLVGDIDQWVMRFFRGFSDVNFGDLHPTAQESLVHTTFERNSNREPKITMKDIKTVVSDQLIHTVFGRYNLAMPEQQIAQQQLNDIYAVLGGTDLEKRKWYTRTLDMIFDGKGYQQNLHKIIDDTTKSLKDILAIRVTTCNSKPGDEQRRDQALYTIVEQGAKLSDEIDRQLSVFQLHPIWPGKAYKPEFMEDISGIVNYEDEEGSVVVDKVLFPIVLRYDFNDAGEIAMNKPIIIRKGIVVLREAY